MVADAKHTFFMVKIRSFPGNLLKLEPWASKPARHYFEGLDMQRNE